MKGFFITATDTDAGKTFVATQLLAYWNRRGYKTLAFKPIASGCQLTEEGLRNADAVQLMCASSIHLDYPEVNPYAFAPAIAPHVAAQLANELIDIPLITQNIQFHQEQADRFVVEGVGGWLVPLNARETLADLAIALALPVILVVNLRLGCINQALLSVRAIEQSGVRLAGWLANSAQETAMANLQDTILSIKERVRAPLLGVLPHISKASSAKQVFEDCIDMHQLSV